MTTLREELEKLARAYVDVRDDDLPIRANALVIAAASLALEAAARECDAKGAALVERWQNADDEMRTYAQARAWDYGLCASAIRAMRVG